MFNDFRSYNIVIDEEAFNKAVEEFEALSERLGKLDQSIETMLSDLQKGFNSDAGNKFVTACRESLRAPINDQKAVVSHIAETLTSARDKYSKVFEEYDSLNSAIKGYNHDA